MQPAGIKVYLAITQTPPNNYLPTWRNVASRDVLLHARRQDYPPGPPHETLEPVRLTTKTRSADQEAADSISRRRLSDTFANRIDNAGESRSRYHHAFHHAGTTMVASPRNTARRARSANFSGANGRNRSKVLRSSSSLTPAMFIRPYWPPVIIGVRITPGQNTDTCTPWRSASRRNAFEIPTTACLVAV